MRDIFLKIDVEDKNRAQWGLVDLSMNHLAPKLSKAFVLLGMFDNYFKDGYPNCTVSQFM